MAAWHYGTRPKRWVIRRCSPVDSRQPSGGCLPPSLSLAPSALRSYRSNGTTRARASSTGSTATWWRRPYARRSPPWWSCSSAQLPAQFSPAWQHGASERPSTAESLWHWLSWARSWSSCGSPPHRRGTRPMIRPLVALRSSSHPVRHVHRRDRRRSRGRSRGPRRPDRSGSSTATVPESRLDACRGVTPTAG